MSRIRVHLRLHGDFERTDDLMKTFEGMPTQVLRRGTQQRGGRVQPVDVILLELASWDGTSLSDQEAAEREQLLPAAARLEQLAPVLAALDRSRCQAELYISTIRDEDQGGFGLPTELIAAAAAGRLALEVSILVMLDDYDLDDKSANVERESHEQQPSREPA